MKKQSGHLLLQYLVASLLTLSLLTFSLLLWQRCFKFFYDLDYQIQMLNQYRLLHEMLSNDLKYAGISGCNTNFPAVSIGNEPLLSPTFSPLQPVQLLEPHQANLYYNLKTNYPVLLIQKTILISRTFKNTSDEINLSLKEEDLPSVGDVLLLTDCRTMKLMKVNYIRKFNDHYRIGFEGKLTKSYLNYMEIFRPEFVLYYWQSEPKTYALYRKEIYEHKYLPGELLSTNHFIPFSLHDVEGNSILEINETLKLQHQTWQFPSLFIS